MEFDELILSALSNIPKNNSEALKVYIMNMCILKRFDTVSKSHDESEEFLAKSLPKNFDNMSKIMKSLKQSNLIIHQSDHSLDKLFGNLGKLES